MKETYYFSRNYVEFGAFTAEEIADFKKRGILWESDYVRSLETETWETVSEWATKNGNSSGNGATKPAKTKAPATRKKAATTKASKKAA